MRTFEYGIHKNGCSALAYVEGRLLRTEEDLPMLTLCDSMTPTLVMGEVHNLGATELMERDALYVGYRRERMALHDLVSRNRREVDPRALVNVYVAAQPTPGKVLTTGVWSYPRVRCDVFRLECPDGEEFTGSKREIIEQLYRGQWISRTKLEFKDDMARRVEMLRGLPVRVATLDEFFADLTAAGAVRLFKVWPRKGHEPVDLGAPRVRDGDLPLPF
jgi:hypothetical protein